MPFMHLYMMHITLCKLFGISKIVEVYAFVVNVNFECEFEQVTKLNVSVEGQLQLQLCFWYWCEFSQ